MKSRQERHVDDIAMIRTIARLADMLEYASWDYPEDALEAKKLVAEADEILLKVRMVK